MDYSKFLSDLQKVHAQISEDKRFRANLSIERGFSADEFGDLQESLNSHGLTDVAIWSEFRKMFSRTNGFVFEWLFDGDDMVDKVAGSAEILPVQAIYLPENMSDDRLATFYGEKRVLDRISPDDQVVVKFAGPDTPPELHYFSDRTGRYHRLGLNFDDYLENLMETRAMYRWQEFFVADDGFDIPAEEAEQFRGTLAALFPDADISRLSRRAR